MATSKAIVVYNATQSEQIVVDEEGHVAYPSEWAICVKRSFIKDYLDNAKLVEVDLSTVGEDSDPSLILLKQEVEQMNNSKSAKPASAQDTKQK